MRLFLREFLGYKKGVQAFKIFLDEESLLTLPWTRFIWNMSPGFPFFFLIHYKKPCLNFLGFIPFHFFLLSFHPLYLSPPHSRKEKTKGIQEWQKREFLTFLSFLSWIILMTTLQHALSQTDTGTKSTRVQPCRTVLLPDRLQPWISCFHAI